ncbi:hypothetical protein V1264_017006 [Littorina saxatilis]|uniref:Uncharacterized protein n=1 Tax=Littorina saxatilis TaxID=31220 RepID=A0AAN9BI86_9CAEN
MCVCVCVCVLIPDHQNPGNDKSVSMYVNAVPTTTTSQGSDAVSNDKLVSMYVNTMPTTITSQGPRHANSRGHAIAQDALGYSEDLPAVLVRKAAHDPSSEMSNWPADNRWISEIEEEGEEEGEEEDERVSRPLLISLAGVVVVFCDLITYVYFEVFLLDEGRLLDWEEYRSGLKWKVKLWASATILQIVGMTLVSGCWLLDHVIRPLIPKYFRSMDCSKISTPSAP